MVDDDHVSERSVSGRNRFDGDLEGFRIENKPEKRYLGLTFYQSRFSFSSVDGDVVVLKPSVHFTHEPLTHQMVLAYLEKR